MQQYFLSGNYNTDLIKGLMNGWMKYKLSLAAKLQQRAPRWLWGLICDVWSERRYGRTDWWEVRGGSQNSLVTEATEQQRGWSCTSCCVCVYRSTELPEGGAAVPWMGGGCYWTLCVCLGSEAGHCTRHLRTDMQSECEPVKETLHLDLFTHFWEL